MNTKLFYFFVCALLLAMGGTLFAQTTITLDEAIFAGSQEIEARLAPGTRVVVLNFKSNSSRFSDYVVEELMTMLVRNGKLFVVDRANLALIQQEMDFQLSGEVSDSSAQSIGHKLGAQSIVSGSIEDMNGYYRMRFRTLNVETAAIQALSSSNVTRDNQIVNLLAGGSTGTGKKQQQVSVTGYPHGLNFSSGYKVGMGFANWFFGAGSFAMGDVAGGLIVGGIETAAIAVSIVGLVKMYGLGNSPDEDDFLDKELYEAASEKWNSDYDKYIILASSGVSIYMIGVIAGYIRPFSYDKALAKKKGTYFAFDPSNPMPNFSLYPIPTKTGMQMGLTFSMSY